MRARTLALAASAIAALGCSDGGDLTQGPGGESPDNGIAVRNNFFDPSALEVAAGTAVVWTWASDGTEHNVTFADGQSSGNQGSGTYQRTFAAAGDYSYRCTIHPGTMTGVVSVGAPPGGGGGGGGDSPYLSRPAQ